MVGAKDVENRKQQRKYTGRLYIHVGKTENVDAVEEVTERVAEHLGISASAVRARYRRYIERWGLGAIIGYVQMFGCAVSHESEWFKGPYGYLLRDPVQTEATEARDGFPGNPVQVHAMTTTWRPLPAPVANSIGGRGRYVGAGRRQIGRGRGGPPWSRP